MKTYFKLVKEPDGTTGTPVDTLFRCIEEDDGKLEVEPWCTVIELDTLFQACSNRWGNGNWDLNKVMTAIKECEFD